MSGGNTAVHLLLEENEEKDFPEKRHERNRRTSKYNKSKRKIKKALNEYMWQKCRNHQKKIQNIKYKSSIIRYMFFWPLYQEKTHTSWWVSKPLITSKILYKFCSTAWHGRPYLFQPNSIFSDANQFSNHTLFTSSVIELKSHWCCSFKNVSDLM